MYDKYLSVNEKFKPSINLLYDLNNEDKVLQFVPTTDLCDVIKDYLKSVIEGDNSKSTLLAGPYGKGKSYLILMIIYLLSKRENKQLLKAVINKFRAVDNELADMIQTLDDNDVSLLPVIINNNESDDINQNFMLALNNSLSNAGINDIVTNSSFSECLSILEKWEDDKEILKDCINVLKISTKELKKGLKKFKKESYDDFCKLYSCVTRGLSFNPLAGNDFGGIYENIARSIEPYGYKGIFVVFDEFGVFLETQNSDFSVRLNKIQAFAEKANASISTAQIHFCCITHKDIKLYKKDKYAAEFEKIAGRFKEVRFDRSLEENYQILCGAINKKDNYAELICQAKETYKNFYSGLKKSGIFSSDKQVDFIGENAYPINPVTLYSLIQISEKIAQNERTLFTYISDNDQKGFRYFVANNDYGMINVDSVFDYFKDSIKENIDYRSIYYKTESLMRATVKEEEQTVIKTIAIIKLINDDVKFVCSPSTIALCLAKGEEDTKILIDSLIKSHKLKRDINDGTIDFSVVADEEINNLIDRTVRSMTSEKVSDLLTEFDKNKYFISHKYNFEYKMTRFYESTYMEASWLKQFESKDILFENHECDGLLINVLNDDGSNIENIKSICNKNNLLIRFNKYNLDLDIKDMLYRVFAMKSLLKKSRDYSESTVEALTLLLEDTSIELQNYIDAYNNESVIIGNNGIVFKTLKDAIYDTLTSTFYKTFILNNEQINKHEISSVITKSRNKVINNMLEVSEHVFSPTSAESTILNSFNDALERENAEEVISTIKTLIINANDKMMKLSDITDVLVKEPYGIRKGVIPLYLAYVMKSLTIKGDDFEDNVMIYNGHMELALTAENLTKVMLNPSNFFVSYKVINKQRLELMDDLLTILKLESQNSFIKDVNNFVTKLRVYVTNLEPTIIKSSKRDNVINLSKQALDFKDLMLKRDLNAYETVDKELPGKLKVSSEDLPKEITKILNEYKSKMDKFYNRVSNELKDMMESTDESIHTSYSLWKNKHYYIKDIIFDDDYKYIYQTLESIQHNDKDSLNSISHSVIKNTLDDYNIRKYDLFFEKFGEFVKFVEDYDINGLKKGELLELENRKFSNLGKTLYSNLEDTIDEYGESISNEEKVIILKKLINDILD